MAEIIIVTILFSFLLISILSRNPPITGKYQKAAATFNLSYSIGGNWYARQATVNGFINGFYTKIHYEFEVDEDGESDGLFQLGGTYNVYQIFFPNPLNLDFFIDTNNSDKKIYTMDEAFDCKFTLHCSQPERLIRLLNKETRNLILELIKFMYKNGRNKKFEINQEKIILHAASRYDLIPIIKQMYNLAQCITRPPST